MENGLLYILAFSAMAIALFATILPNTFLYSDLEGLPHHTISSYSELSDGLVLYYPLRAGFGAYATDYGNYYYNNGTITSATWTTGRYGYGLDFDGTNSYVSIPNSSSLSLTNVFSFAAWVRFDSVATGRQTIFGCENYAYGFAFECEFDGTYAILSAARTGEFIARAYLNATWFPAGNWYHVGYSRSGEGADTHTIYLNGVSYPLSTNSATNFAAVNGSRYLGRRAASSQMLNGALDEVRLYNRTLLASEFLILATLEP